MLALDRRVPEQSPTRGHQSHGAPNAVQSPTTPARQTIVVDEAHHNATVRPEDAGHLAEAGGRINEVVDG